MNVKAAALFKITQPSYPSNATNKRQERKRKSIVSKLERIKAIDRIIFKFLRGHYKWSQDRIHTSMEQ